jgi:hypothetical protein
VNVTTVDPGVDGITKTSAGDQTYGIRSVQTQEPSGFCGCGGIAFIDSFGDPIDNPVFVFNKGPRNGGMTISHEVGHSVGLFHDGLYNLPYHPGTGGSGGWGPIMGAPFGKKFTQWNPGDYDGATEFENDLLVITKPANGFGFRPDAVGDSIATATLLTRNGNLIFDWGIIEKTDDVDYWTFSTGDGQVTIEINPFGGTTANGGDPNLNVGATLYNSLGEVVATADPLNVGYAHFTNLYLTAGTYTIAIDGVAREGYHSEYGSLGFYFIDGTIVSPIDGDFDNDGDYDINDIDALVGNIAIGPADPDTFDLTGDGLVNLADRDTWLAEAGAANLPSGNPYLVADSNLDGTVDGQDFVTWNRFKFSPSGLWSRADFNADGFTDGMDFEEWNANKFMTSEQLRSGPTLNQRARFAGIEQDEEEFPARPFMHRATHAQTLGHHVTGEQHDEAFVSLAVVSAQHEQSVGQRGRTSLAGEVVEAGRIDAAHALPTRHVEVSDRFLTADRSKGDGHELIVRDLAVLLIEELFAGQSDSLL